MNGRPLEFRVWDRLINKMMPDLSTISFDDKEYEFMQFTGLLDKDGKKIFEGDIVTVLDEKNIFLVKFGPIERLVKSYDEHLGCFLLEFNTFYFEQQGIPYLHITKNHLGKHDRELTTVIGNIFENPDLFVESN